MRKEKEKEIENIEYPLPKGVISAEDDRILDGLMDFFKQNSTEKRNSVLKKKARKISNNFGKFFDAVNDYSCVIFRKIDNNRGKKYFFTELGIKTILEVDLISTLRNRKGVNPERTPPILDEELSAMKYALNKLVEFKNEKH